jgi:hypothetical protein
MVDERLLEILVCPECKGDIRPDGDWLICDECRVKYPVRDGIPIMFTEEAEPLEECEEEA